AGDEAGKGRRSAARRAARNADAAGRGQLKIPIRARPRRARARMSGAATWPWAKGGCPAWIRTTIDGVRVRSLTIRRRGNEAGEIGRPAARVNARVARQWSAPCSRKSVHVQGPQVNGRLPAGRNDNIRDV